MDYIPTCSSRPPPPNTMMELTEALLSHFPAEDSALTWDRTEARDQPGSPSGEDSGRLEGATLGD